MKAYHHKTVLMTSLVLFVWPIVTGRRPTAKLRPDAGSNTCANARSNGDKQLISPPSHTAAVRLDQSSPGAVEVTFALTQPANL